MKHLNVVVFSPQLKPIHFYLTPRYIIHDNCSWMEYHFSLYKELFSLILATTLNKI